jgi:hypothetical protein
MTYLCPVCGFDKLRTPPENHAICPCCGTEFDYHDATRSHSQLRYRWIGKGAEWFSRTTRPPRGWDWYKQLSNASMLSIGLGSSIHQVTSEEPTFPLACQEQHTYQLC